MIRVIVYKFESVHKRIQQGAASFRVLLCISLHRELTWLTCYYISTVSE